MGNKYVTSVSQNIRKPTYTWMGWHIIRKMKKDNPVLINHAVDLCNIEPHHKVLEIGFGHGIGIKKACQKVSQEQKGQVYGIELSPYMMMLSQKHLRSELNSGQLQLLLGSVYNLPYNNNRFDRVYHTDTYYLWANMERACSELYRVMGSHSHMVTVLDYQKFRAGNNWRIYSRFNTDLVNYMSMLEIVGFDEVGIEYVSSGGRQFQAVHARIGEKTQLTDAERAFERMERARFNEYIHSLDSR